MSPMGAVGISECFPATDHHRELVEPQTLSVTDQQLRRSGELFGTARVGEHLGQQMCLGQPEHTAMRRITRFGDGVQQPRRLDHRLGLTTRTNYTSLSPNPDTEA